MLSESNCRLLNYKVVNGRSYGQYCGIARALDLVGERWALLVLRELVLGPKRFTDLRHGLPGVATNVLTQRLKQLERDGIISRRFLPPPAASIVYELTEYGRELEPIMLQLGVWGAKTMAQTPGQLIRSEWLMVGLKAYFRPDAAKGVRATIGLKFADGAYAIRIAGRTLQVMPGLPENASLTLDTDGETLRDYLAGAQVPIAELSPEGDLMLLERLPAIFAFGGRVELNEAAARP
jgi:DNA-binding HxlR family transcriptional regulator